MNNELQNLKNEYLERSKTWFYNNFVGLGSKVRQLFVVLIIFIACAYTVFSVSNVRDNTITLPYPLYFDDSIDYFLTINPIKNQTGNINIDVAKYLLQKYLENLEDFDVYTLSPERLEKKLKILYNISSLQVFKQYFQQIDVKSNSESPLLIYRFGNTRKVDIKKIHFPQKSDVPSEALISYNVIKNINNEKKIEKKNKKIKFFMSKINKDFFKNKKKFFFLITNQEEYNG